MMGMLMSVMMTSYFVDASLRRPSTPSSASVTRRFFTRGEREDQELPHHGRIFDDKAGVLGHRSVLQVDEGVDARHLPTRIGEESAR